MSKSFPLTIGCALLLSAVAQAAPMVYPARGQTPEQQSRDQAECAQWASQQAGSAPAQPAPAPAKSGGAVRGGARGAALGAAVGAIAGDAGKGAAIGATAGGMGGAMKKRGQARNAQPAENPAQANYDRALAACLEGRGYSVR